MGRALPEQCYVAQALKRSLRIAPRPAAAALNVFGGVLIWKRKAEEALERSGMPYVIVRPGEPVSAAACLLCFVFTVA